VTTVRINEVKQKLSQGRPVYGAEAALGSVLVAESLAVAGFEFVQVDNQHGEWSYERLMAALRGICLGGALPMSRVRSNSYSEIGTVLDLGALGIVVPMVNSAEEARRVAQAAFYPPHGERSSGAIGVGIHGSPDDYRANFREQALVIVQIETREAVERVGEILAVDGIDGCMVGPHDLGISMGVPHWSPEHEGAIEQALQGCVAAGKIPGIAAWGTGVNAPEHRAAQGFRFIQATSDRELLPTGAQALLARIRAGGVQAGGAAGYY
jgi:4-hydroxy-2-oxoheptanedioate aldolase